MTDKLPEEIATALNFLKRLRKDYINTCLAARIPGWQNIDNEFERTRKTLLTLLQQCGDK